MSDSNDSNRDDRVVSDYLEALAGVEPEAPLPSPDAIWDRARVARRIEWRRERVRRAVRPVERVERGFGLAAATAAVTWTWWRWDRVVELSARLVEEMAGADPWTALGIAATTAVLAALGAEHAAHALRRV